MDGPVVVVPAGGSNFSIATCPAGQTAVSGGWGSDFGVIPGNSEQVTTNTAGDSWQIIGDNPTDENASIFAIAYCSP
ncbi:hypothetical protein [Streptomyces sp. NPDC127084]|uniref:hypothetical protein n=1 Tax=Streptomyces sp. NPDC127084 TaxID=3347133 RepID=UPI003668CEAC